jgi:hypothetical protein
MHGLVFESDATNLAAHLVLANPSNQLSDEMISQVIMSGLSDSVERES